MATSSILGGERAAELPAGKSIGSLGPSDSSDSGSDTADRAPKAPADSGLDVPAGRDGDTDSAGTGERASATPEGQDGPR